MNNRIKTILKYVGGVVGVLAIIYLICLIIFFSATHQNRKAAQDADNIAREKTPITQITQNYHLSRKGVVSDSLEGTDKKGKKYYFIYIPKTKKAYLYKANKGWSKSRVINRFNLLHSGLKVENTKVNLGWYHGVPAWEVAYKKENDRYGYAIYSFKSGRELFYVDNL